MLSSVLQKQCLWKQALTRDDVRGIWLQDGITSSEAEELVREKGPLYVEDRCMFKEHRRLTR